MKTPKDLQRLEKGTAKEKESKEKELKLKEYMRERGEGYIQDLEKDISYVIDCAIEIGEIDSNGGILEISRFYIKDDVNVACDYFKRNGWNARYEPVEESRWDNLFGWDCYTRHILHLTPLPK